MARHRHHRRRVTTYLFKKNAGHWKRFRGNPFKKHIVRGRRAVKHNIAAGHFDKSGKFHRRKNFAAYYDAQGRFHPVRASTGPTGTLAKTRYKESKAYAGHHLRKGRKRKKAGKKRRR